MTRDCTENRSKLLLLVSCWSFIWLFIESKDAAAQNETDISRSYFYLNPALGRVQSEIDRLSITLNQYRKYEPVPHNRVGFHSKFYAHSPEHLWVQVDLGSSVKISDVAIVPALLYTYAYGLPASFHISVSNDPQFLDAQVVARSSDKYFSVHQSYPIQFTNLSAQGRFVRLICDVPAVKEGEGYFMAIGELIVLSKGINVAALSPVASNGSIEVLDRWSTSYLVDCISSLRGPFGHVVSDSEGFQSQIIDPTSPQYIQFDFGQPEKFVEIDLISAYPREQPDIPAWGFPSAFTVSASNDPDFHTENILYEIQLKDVRCSGRPFVIPIKSQGLFRDGTMASLEKNQHWKDIQQTIGEYPSPSVSSQYIRISVQKADSRLEPSTWAFSEIQILSEQKNIALNADVISSPIVPPNNRWSLDFLKDGIGARCRVQTLPGFLAEIEKQRGIQLSLQSLFAEREIMIASASTRLRWALAAIAGLFIVLVSGLLWYQRWRNRFEINNLQSELRSDLHDDIGSNLGTIALLGQALLTMPELSNESRNDIKMIETIASDTSAAMRDMLWLMRPEEIEIGEFISQLRLTANRLLPQIKLDFPVPKTHARLSVGLRWRREVFLAYKELLHNIAKHSGATSVRIETIVDKDRFTIVLCDNGRSVSSDLQKQFDECLIPTISISSKHGIANITNRITKIDGSLKFTGESGTQIQFSLPLAKSV